MFFISPKTNSHRSLLLAFVLIYCVSSLRCPPALHAQGPENTLVVVNADSQDSLAVANRFVHLRQIPPVNIVYVRAAPIHPVMGPEGMSSKAFRSHILSPILNAMRDRGIKNQIDCIAYSSGFPTRINFKPEREVYLKQAGLKYNIQRHAPWASITSLTYFYRNAFSDRPDFLELDANSFANPRRMKVLANPFEGEDAKTFNNAIRSERSGNYDQAIESLLALARVHQEQIAVLYPLARCFAAKAEPEKAMTVLEQAVKVGFATRSLLLRDNAFKAMRSLPEFKALVDQLEDLPDGSVPTRSFSAQRYWSKNGWPNGNAEQGDRYLLSSVLAVTGENQSTLEASLERLHSSAQADGTNPQGVVYFADHKNVRSRTRRAQFPAAAKELKTLGVEALIGADIYPLNNPRVIGATLGSAAPKWSKSKSQFLPGAICDNLTSYGAWWEKSAQTQISEWLDAGAAGASGTVFEPYAIAPKFPSARWHAHYARGATLAESFYQSVSGPFQLLLVGDPLCRPFGDFPAFKIEGLIEGAKIDRDFVLQINPLPDSPNVQRYEIYYDGVFLGRISNPENVAVATDGMNDGYHELRIVGVANSPVACKTTKSIDFLVDREGQNLNFTVPNPKVEFGGDLPVRALHSGNGKIQIHQNYRPVGLIKKGGSTTIPTAKLGLGLSQLQAVVTLEDGTVIHSKPVTVEVLP